MKMTRDVRWLDQQISKGFTAAIGKSERLVTPTQMLLLGAIQELSGANQTQLVNATLIDRSTLSDVLQRLCATGHCERVDNRQDGRAYSVTITKNGKQLFTVNKPRLLKVEADLAPHAKILAKSW